MFATLFLSQPAITRIPRMILSIPSLYFAIIASISRSTGYRSSFCLYCRRGCVCARNVSIILITLSLSHFPRSSRAINALAHDPRPSLSSSRERMKSQRRFPSHYLSFVHRLQGYEVWCVSVLEIARGRTYSAGGRGLSEGPTPAPPRGTT
jgi:hypothetical protein